jgi:threonine dehydratase
VLVSVGGGGLIAGIAAWCAGRCRVEALEPEGAHAARRARRRPAGGRGVGGLAADSLGARRIGASPGACASASWPPPPAGRRGHPRRAAALWRELRLAVEPAAALPPGGAVDRHRAPAPHERVALVLCGANLDPATLA